MADGLDSDREDWVVLCAVRGGLAPPVLAEGAAILEGVGRLYAPSRLGPFKRALPPRYPLVA
jgi:hypothetical protein